MDDLQIAKKFLKIVAKSQANAERQRTKDRADDKRQRAKNRADDKRQRAKDRADDKRQRAKNRADDKRKQAIADKERAELRKQSKQTDKQLKQTDKQLKQTGEQLKRTEVLVGHLSNRFGDIAEAMLVGDVAETLQTINSLQLKSTHFNVKRTNGNTIECEIDALLVGQDSIVVMEAKSTLTTSKIEKFIDSRLNRFTELFPDFANKKIYGAVGYLKAEDNAIKLAIKEGLLVVRSSLQVKEIINPADFKPKNYNPHYNHRFPQH